MPELYLKTGTGKVADDISAEMLRLQWLGQHVAVPALMRFERTPDEAWLLMTALPGQTAYQLMARDAALRPVVTAALARFLRRLHAIPVSSCPFTSEHGYRLAQARADRCGTGRQGRFR